MKKVLSILLVAALLLGIVPTVAFAVSGPSPASDGLGNYVASLEAYDYSEGTNYEIFTNNTVKNEAPNMTYDRASNTLTLNNLDGSLTQLTATAMGDDFTIVVNGTCTLYHISAYASGYGSSLTIKGEGELTVNEQRWAMHGIIIQADSTDGKFICGKDVKLRVYGSQGESAVVSMDSTGKTPDDVFIFENGQKPRVRRVIAETTRDEFASVVLYKADGLNYYGGVRLTTPNDPDGIYAVREFTRDEDGSVYYEVTKCVYISKYNAYAVDYNYLKGHPQANSYGTLEYTEAEWESQTEFTVVTRPAADGAKIKYYDPDELDGTSYYTATQVTRASDPTGIYSRSSYSITDGHGNVEERGYNIYRYVYAPAPHNKKLIRDTSFSKISITEEEFASSAEWSVTQGVEEVTLEWTNFVELEEMGVYKNTAGVKYVVDYYDNVYSYSENNGIAVGGNFYVYLTKVNVALSTLKKSTVKETADESSYYMDTDEFGYNVHMHDYSIAESVRPTANGLGYTKYKCSCGEYQKDSSGNILLTYIAPTGKPAGFKCAARTATAMKFTWTKNAKAAGVSGYQVQLLTSAGKNAGLATTTGNAYTFSKLVAGHAYKARIRLYIKAADGKNYYGPWATINSPTLPAGTAITKLTPAKKAFTAQWKKGAVTGYQLQYSTNKKFTGAKTVTIKKPATIKYAVKNLASKRAYYVRIRTYKTMNKVNYYSTWSGAKAVKTK